MVSIPGPPSTDPSFDAPQAIISGDTEGDIGPDNLLPLDFGLLDVTVTIPNDSWEIVDQTWSISDDPDNGVATITQGGLWIYTVDQAYYDSLDFGEVVTDQFTVLILVDALNPSGNPQVAVDTQVITITIEGVCFVDGTQILTPTGETAIENLSIGQRVETLDHGPVPIKWIESQEITPAEITANPNLAPVKIKAGALGRGLPQRDLMVSQEHRILISGAKAELLFGETEVLVAAKELLAWPGIDLCQPTRSIAYFHILLENHEILFAEGALAESLFLGNESLCTLGPEALRELSAIFPQPARGRASQFGTAARRLLCGYEAKTLLAS